MSTNVAEPPVLASRPSCKTGGGRLLPPAALAAGVAVPLAALAAHFLLPNKQAESLNWLVELPKWQHPYPLFLCSMAAAGLAGSIAFTLGYLRSVLRLYSPLLAGVALWLLLWEYTTVKTNWLRLPFFPGPDDVLGGLIEDRIVLLKCTGHSLLLLFFGYILGVAAGITTGVLIGWYPSVRYWAMPAVKFFGPIPASALLAVAFAFWKEPFNGAVALIAFAVWFPVNILTSSGIANVRLSYLDVARTLGAGPGYLIFRVAIPAAMPNIFIGMFMGLVVSFLTLNVAELVGVDYGLGWYMRWRKDNMDYEKMYASLLISAAFFSTILSFLFIIRDRVLVWQKGVIKW
jgi:NitT/TauT family transport system permease protein